jgi:hypothetical protein
MHICIICTQNDQQGARMTSMNRFEQQAGRAPAAPRDASARHETPLAAAMRFIEGANVSQCGKVAAHLSARLFALEKRHGGAQAANLEEAAHFVADAVLDIHRALDAGSEAPCACGGCDECIAARSDKRYDRKRDATLA